MSAWRNLALIVGMVFMLLLIFLVNSLAFLWGVEIVSVMNALIVTLFFAFGYYLVFKPSDRKRRR